MLGVVLQTYGAGNGPDTRADLLGILREASQRGVIVLNITQCYRGSVSAAYAAGKVRVTSAKLQFLYSALSLLRCWILRYSWLL
jgi:L-asparaginase/Glu-tRNA(Gln) amidotransferase subunit D